MNGVKKWLWPDISNRRNVLGAIDEAFWVALAVGGYRLAWALISYLRDSDNPLSSGLLLSGILIGSLAIGIHYRSRVAAMLAFTLYVGESLYSMFVHPVIPILPALVALALLAGVRGTFAYCKLPVRPVDLPSVAESFQSLKTADSSKDPASH